MTQLFITNGTTAVNLIWHSVANRSYLLTRGDWAPTIPALQMSSLAQGGLYADVQEDIPINVYGQTAAECLSNLATLAELLDQADRWSPKRGENVAAVRLQYMPTGGALLLECVIIGRAGGDETSGISLPLTFNRDLGAYLIEGVRLRFWRRGQLLNPTAETGTYSAAAAAPTVHTITLSTPTTISSPTLLQFEYSQAGIIDNYDVEYAYALTASAASRLQIYEAESMSLGTNVASAADAAAFARGGSVARYSPGVLSTTLSLGLVGFDTAARIIAVWAAVRNNSATTNFTIQAQAGSNTGVVQTAPAVPIDTSTTNPRLIFLGIIAFQLAFDGVNLLLTASAASGTFDIDYIIVQAVDDETSGALRIFGANGAATPLTGQGPLTIDPRPLSAPTPIVTSFPSSITTPMSYAGSPTLYTRGSFVALLMGKTTGNFWRIVGGVSVVDSRVLAVARYGAYLTPR
jgi:hypothetical protein